MTNEELIILLADLQLILQQSGPLQIEGIFY